MGNMTDDTSSPSTDGYIMSNGQRVPEGYIYYNPSGTAGGGITLRDTGGGYEADLAASRGNATGGRGLSTGGRGDPADPADPVDPVDPNGPPDPVDPNGSSDSGNPSGSGVNIRPWHGTLGQRDTSWDWDVFAPKPQGSHVWGGFDKDYEAFERYMPGRESQWGNPNTQYGNKEFYQQQFANQLRDEQGYQSRERAAQSRRQDAINNPFEAAPTDWSWANNGAGLGKTVISSGTPEDNRAWQLSEGFNESMTNADVLRQASTWEQWTNDEKQRFNRWLTPTPNEDGTEDSLFTDTNWVSAGDPQKIISKLGSGDEELTGTNRDWLTKIFSGLYSKDGKLAPSAPAGYAETLASYAEAGEG